MDKKLISMIIFSVSLVFLAVSILLSTLLIVISRDYASSFGGDIIPISYDGLSFSEIDRVKEIIKDLAPLYLKGHKGITVTNDIKKYQAREGIDNRSIGGFNKGRDIYIQNSNNMEWMKNVICHEILHSFIRSGELAHEVIYDLADKGVCYG